MYIDIATRTSLFQVPAETSILYWSFFVDISISSAAVISSNH